MARVQTTAAQYKGPHFSLKTGRTMTYTEQRKQRKRYVLVQGQARVQAQTQALELLPGAQRQNTALPASQLYGACAA